MFVPRRLLQWQEDGYDASKIRQVFERAKGDLDALHSESATVIATSPHCTKSHSNVDEYSTELEHGMKFIRSVSGSRISKDIFLSYGREASTAPFVARIKNDLEAAGYSVWLDTVDIPSGSDWHSAIGDGLRRCNALLAIITNKYICSKYCKNEMFMADSTHKPIFPLFLEEVDFNSSEDSGVLYTISSINWIKLTNGMAGYDDAFAQLLEGMRGKGVTPRNTPVNNGSTSTYIDDCTKSQQDIKTTQPSEASTENKSESQPKHLFSKKPLKSFSVSDVCLFVEQLELNSKTFKENSVGGEDLLELTDEDMKAELGLKLLQIRKLRRHINTRLAEEQSEQS